MAVLSLADRVDHWKGTVVPPERVMILRDVAVGMSEEADKLGLVATPVEVIAMASSSPDHLLVSNFALKILVFVEIWVLLAAIDDAEPERWEILFSVEVRAFANCCGFCAEK